MAAFDPVFLPLVACLVALGLDRILGEPRLHPLVAFGTLAGIVEKRLNNRVSRDRGTLGLLIVVPPIAALVWYVQTLPLAWWQRLILDILVLYICIGWQSMKEHALAVSVPLLEGDLDEARSQLSRIVSRDTVPLNENQVTGSALESLLENGNDCLFATLFWYAVLGPAGAVCHRLVNTLDAMWGYKNERYRDFGFLAAKFDDALGWIPARLTAFVYAMSGTAGASFDSVKKIRGNHKSPNAGLVMAAGAGSLEVTIGGPVSYEGQMEEKPYLGTGPTAVPADIQRAVRMVNKSLFAWLAIYGILLFSMDMGNSTAYVPYQY